MVNCRLLPVTLAALLLVASPARAASPTETLQEFFAGANAILQAADPMRGLDEARRAVRMLVDQAFDYEGAAQLVLGPVWPTRTPAERTEFVPLFADFLERGFVATIGSKASVSDGVSVHYVGESITGQSAVVSTTMLTRSGGDLPVDYSMVLGNGRWLVRDVVIEGVSLIANYRAQFMRIIRTSSYASLIAKMRGDGDDMVVGGRKYVVTVETTPVPRTPISALPVSPAPLPPVQVSSAPIAPLPAPPVPSMAAALSPAVEPAPAIAAVPSPSVEPLPIVPSPPLPAAPPGALDPSASSGIAAASSYWVQVGAFKTADAAARVVAELKRAGLAVWNGALTTRPGEPDPALVRVRVGPFPSRADAQLKLHELATKGYTPFIAEARN